MQFVPYSEILVGVDGGGTRCRFALLQEGQRVEVVGGPANVSTDLTGALETLSKGFNNLADLAGLSYTSLRSARAYLGLAGVMGAEAAQNVLGEIPFDCATVEDDRATTVVGALGSDDGAVFGIGTGSFLGRQKKEKIKLHGGWGFALADDASGADLVRKALRRTLDGIDGKAQESDLTDTLLQTFGGSGAIVDFAAWAKPGEFAKYAPLVVEAAQAGDKNGIEIMVEGAEYIEKGIRALGWKPGERLCPTGGLAPYYVDFFHGSFARQITPATGTALDGALMLAANVDTRKDQQ